MREAAVPLRPSGRVRIEMDRPPRSVGVRRVVDLLARVGGLAEAPANASFSPVEQEEKGIRTGDSDDSPDGLPPHRRAMPLPGGGATYDLVIGLAFVSEEAMRALNRDFRGQDRATNVLAFPEPFAHAEGPAPEQGLFLGDVVLCLAYCRREARALKLDPYDHLLHLCVHGLLHLRGHRHDTQGETDAMTSQEARLLKAAHRCAPCP